MKFLIPALILTTIANVGCSGRIDTSRSQSPRLLTVTLIDQGPIGPDSATSLRLTALADAARVFVDSVGRAPESLNELLQVPPLSTARQVNWAVDGWKRPLVVSRDRARRTLIVISWGPDGMPNGGDDDFRVIKLK